MSMMLLQPGKIVTIIMVTISDGDDVGGQIVHSEGTVHLDLVGNRRSGAENRCRSPERFELPFVGRIARSCHSSLVPFNVAGKKVSVEYQSVAIVKLVAWSNVGKLSRQSSLSLYHLITLWKVEIKQWALERNSKQGLHLKWFQHPVD